MGVLLLPLPLLPILWLLLLLLPPSLLLPAAAAACLSGSDALRQAWDLGGSQQFRSEWGRYTRGCHVILFCVDTNDRERLPLARKELHALLEDPELAQMPLLVLGNKIDLEPHMSKEEIIKGLNLDYIQDQPWECMAISGLRGLGVERVVDWLVQHSSG